MGEVKSRKGVKIRQKWTSTSPPHLASCMSLMQAKMLHLPKKGNHSLSWVVATATHWSATSANWSNWSPLDSARIWPLYNSFFFFRWSIWARFFFMIQAAFWTHSSCSFYVCMLFSFRVSFSFLKSCSKMVSSVIISSNSWRDRFLWGFTFPSWFPWRYWGEPRPSVSCYSSTISFSLSCGG